MLIQTRLFHFELQKVWLAFRCSSRGKFNEHVGSSRYDTTSPLVSVAWAARKNGKPSNTSNTSLSLSFYCATHRPMVTTVTLDQAGFAWFGFLQDFGNTIDLDTTLPPWRKRLRINWPLPVSGHCRCLVNKIGPKNRKHQHTVSNTWTFTLPETNSAWNTAVGSDESPLGKAFWQVRTATFKGVISKLTVRPAQNLLQVSLQCLFKLKPLGSTGYKCLQLSFSIQSLNGNKPVSVVHLLSSACMEMGVKCKNVNFWLIST